MQPVGRRTRVVVRKVGPWSVLKFSLLFYLCVMLIIYFALMIIYWLLSAVGAIDSAGRLLGYVFATGSAGESEVVVIRFGSVFGWLLLVGLGNVDHLVARERVRRVPLQPDQRRRGRCRGHARPETLTGAERRDAV